MRFSEDGRDCSAAEQSIRAGYDLLTLAGFELGTVLDHDLGIANGAGAEQTARRYSARTVALTYCPLGIEWRHLSGTSERSTWCCEIIQ